MRANAELNETFLCLYLQRRTHAQISAATGLSIAAIEQRITRGELRKKRDDIEKRAIPKVTVAERSEATKAVMAVEVQKSAEALEAIPHSKNLEKAQARATVVHTIAQTAKTVFDWNPPGSGNGGGDTFNFALMDSCYQIDMATLTKSNGRETLPLTAAEIAECKALDEQKANGNAIDIPSTNGHDAIDEIPTPTNGAGAHCISKGQTET